MWGPLSDWSRAVCALVRLPRLVGVGWPLPGGGLWLRAFYLRVGCLSSRVWLLKGVRMPYAGEDRIEKVKRPSSVTVTGRSPAGWFSEDGKHRLTVQQKRFCDEYLARGLTKPVEAYLEAGYKPGSRNAATAAVKNMLARANVREYLELMKPRYEGKLLLTRDYVIEGLKSVAEGSRNDNAKVAALKHLGQYLGMWVERTEVTGADGQPIAFTDAGGALAGVSDENLRKVKELLSARKSDVEDGEGDRALN